MMMPPFHAAFRFAITLIDADVIDYAAIVSFQIHRLRRFRMPLMAIIDTPLPVSFADTPLLIFFFHYAAAFHCHAIISPLFRFAMPPPPYRLFSSFSMPPPLSLSLMLSFIIAH
jgi:hypothetical protein